MKKILILILSICSIVGYGQTQLNPSGSNSVANINKAVREPATAAGTDTYTTTIIGATISSKHEAYTIEFTNANTGSATLNINDGTNNLGAVTLKKFSSGSLVNLSSGDISNGQPIRFRYNGTNFVMEGGSGSGGGGAITDGSATTATANGTAVDLGGTQTSDAVISGDGGTYGMTFDEQEHYTVNVQGGNNAAITVADGGDATITSNSGNVTLTTFSGNATEIIASGTGIAFHVGGDGIKVDLNGDATGDMFSRKSTGFLERIAPNSTGTKKFLTQISSATPVWGTIANTDVSGLGTLSTQNGTFSGTSSGTNTGDQTTVSGNSGTATALQTARTIGTLTGDGTTAGSSFNGTANNTNALTLATVNSNVGSFGSATQVPQITSNGKGLTTAISNVTITPAIGSITGLASNIATFLATSSSSNLIAALTDETGTGSVVFGTTPTIATPVINGLATGTGIASSATASTIVTRDANINIAANNENLTYTTTTTSAGTTTLTIASSRHQTATGSTTHTYLLPVVSTLSTGWVYEFSNLSTGVVTIKSSGSNTLQAMASNSTMSVKCKLITGTTEASWEYNYYPSNPMITTGDLITSTSTGDPTRIAIGSTGDIFTPVAGVPAWSTGLPGVTTNSSAAAGKVGEYVSSLIAVGSATSLTTATAKNVTSISLTAGDWVVSGNVTFTESSATVTSRTAGISSTSATLPTDGSEIENGSLTTLISEKITLTIPPKSIKLSGTTTIYLIGSETFSAGTSSGYGSINAWRVR